MNAGVLVPAPARARRNPKWPKDWEGNWDNCEASAAAMLKAQSIPVKFPAAKVLEEVAFGETEEAFETSVKLSVNFDLEELQTDAMGTCLACGNCLSGCPYNAKSSTDKNYLRSAIQACLMLSNGSMKFVKKNIYPLGCNRCSCLSFYRTFSAKTSVSCEAGRLHS